MKELEIDKMFNSITFKIHAIDEIAKSEGRYTPGTDNIHFMKKIIINTLKPKASTSGSDPGSNNPTEGPGFTRAMRGEENLNQDTLSKEERIQAIETILTQHPSGLISRIAKGKNEHAVQRKGKITLNSEYLRSYLQRTKTGLELVKISNKEYKLIKEEP